EKRVFLVILFTSFSGSLVSRIPGAVQIIPLSVPEIIDLLKTKDEGSDPNTYLFERVDQFLLGLGR
uniref:hypothetical protein n=1 Tax=Escherichia coli TaxID=562 RepID=UPI001BC83105